MDIFELKKLIIDNADTYIPTILEDLDLKKINPLSNEIRCCRNEDGSGTSIRVKKDTLFFTDFSTNVNGDLITLVQDIKNYSFKEAISFICKSLNISEDIVQKQIVLPFGGYFNSLKTYSNDVEEELKTYPDEILNDYWNVANKRFLRDGVSIKTQLKHNIGYDLETDRIIIPWYNLEGQIIGIMGRINCSSKEIEEKGIAKYFPIIPFAKSRVLYGLDKNYRNIINNTVLVFEAEKSVLKCDSLNNFNAVAVGSHNISEQQMKLLHSTYPKHIIICFDEGIDRDIIVSTAKKVKEYISFNQVNVGYIFDENNKYIEKDSKDSPIDKGENVFKSLLQECLYWI